MITNTISDKTMEPPLAYGNETIAIIESDLSDFHVSLLKQVPVEVHRELQSENSWSKVAVVRSVHYVEHFTLSLWCSKLCVEYTG